MDAQLQNLVLMDDEEDELVLEEGGTLGPPVITQFCLVGRFLTDKVINFMAMKNRMATLWQPRQGLTITECPPNRYLFQFYHQFDMKRVFEGGPWTFNGFLLILNRLQEGKIPRQVPLTSVPIWVQIHELPLGFMSENIGKQLGNFLGTFVDYDCQNNSGVWQNYMRIRVGIDVQKPLKRAKKIKLANEGWTVVTFKYERLPTFCFICGLLGHNDKFCAQLFEKADAEIKREWGVWLRAPGRGVDRSGDRWLRNGVEDDRWIEKESQNMEGNKANSQEMIVVHSLSVTKPETVTLDKGKELAVSNEIQKDSSSGLDSEEMGLELIDDRKKRKVDLDQSLSKVSTSTTQYQQFNMIVDTQQDHVLPDATDDSNQHFLSAGSVLQTCRQP